MNILATLGVFYYWRRCSEKGSQLTSFCPGFWNDEFLLCFPQYCKSQPLGPMHGCSSWRAINSNQKKNFCEAFIINKNYSQKKKSEINPGVRKTLPSLRLWNTSSWLKKGCTSRKQQWIRNEPETSSAQYCFWQPLLLPEQCNALGCMCLKRPPEYPR